MLTTSPSNQEAHRPANQQAVYTVYSFAWPGKRLDDASFGRAGRRWQCCSLLDKALVDCCARVDKRRRLEDHRSPAARALSTESQLLHSRSVVFRVHLRRSPNATLCHRPQVTPRPRPTSNSIEQAGKRTGSWRKGFGKACAIGSFRESEMRYRSQPSAQAPADDVVVHLN